MVIGCYSARCTCDHRPITFKNRHSPEFLHGTLTRMPGDGAQYIIESQEKVQGIAPGQFAVIYDEASHICYGSGIITLHDN